MNAQEAAAKLKPSFHLASMPPEDRHHVLFVEAVAAELGVEPTAFNLYQVAEALDAAAIHEDSNEYPKMLYSRRHHAVEGIEASTYDKRHDHVWTHVANEDQAKALGAGWVENPADLPPRGDTPIDAEKPATVLDEPNDPEAVDPTDPPVDPPAPDGVVVHPDEPAPPIDPETAG